MTHTRNDTRWFWLTATLFGFLTVLFLVWVTLRLGGARLSDAVDDVGELLAALAAAAACSAAARRRQHARAAWGFLAASSFAWASGEAVWCYYDLVRGVQLPFPSLADVGFLSAVPLAVVGLRKFPGAAPSGTSELPGLLDRMLVGFAVFFVIWATVVGAVWHASGILQQVVGLAYPLSDLVMASVVLLATRRGTRDRTSLHLVLAGILAFTLADSSFAYLTAAGSYGSGNALDTGWVLGYLLVALGALWAMINPAPAAGEITRATRSTIQGPYLRVTAAGATGLSLKESAVFHGAYMKPSWFTKATADQIVYAGSVLIILADAAISLYDLAQILKLIN
jgi:diguanylate cyclase